MNRREINTTYAKLQLEAERIVFDAIAESCRKNGTTCLTNGPYGTNFTRECKRGTEGSSYHFGQYNVEVKTPKYIETLIDWYEERFGPLPQAINKKGSWE